MIWEEKTSMPLWESVCWASMISSLVISFSSTRVLEVVFESIDKGDRTPSGVRDISKSECADGCLFVFEISVRFEVAVGRP